MKAKSSATYMLAADSGMIQKTKPVWISRPQIVGFYFSFGELSRFKGLTGLDLVEMFLKSSRWSRMSDMSTNERAHFGYLLQITL